MAARTPASLDEYGRTWLRGHRVLVVDDVEQQRARLVDQLQAWELRVDVAAGPEEALEALQGSFDAGHPLEAVVVGLGTPDAHVLTEAIADQSRFDGVAMVVLASGEVDMVRLRRAGVSVCLTRPVSADVLRGTLLEQVVGVVSRPLDAPAERPRRERRRILVVDDSPVNQLVASGLLTSMDYDVDVAADGAVALAMIAVTAYDSVLMDVQMPVLDGYAATRALRDRENGGAHLPVIAMTAAAVEGERERCLNAGMDDFLTKPVDPVALAATLQRWLQGAPASPPPPGGLALGLGQTPPMAGLDVERLDMLRDLDPGDTTYLDRAIGNFQVNSAAAVATIERLVDEQDVAAVRAAAHKIAGSALNLGVPRAGEAARAVELLAGAGVLDGVEALLPELVEAMTQARSLLLDYQATYTAG